MLDFTTLSYEWRRIFERRLKDSFQRLYPIYTNANIQIYYDTQRNHELRAFIILRTDITI